MTAALIGRLSDRDWGVRVNAIATLGRIGDDLVMPNLERIAEDPDGRISRAATEAMASIRERWVSQTELPPWLRAVHQERVA